MKTITLTLTTEEGEVIGEIENIEEYDLDKPMARIEVISKIQHFIELHD